MSTIDRDQDRDFLRAARRAIRSALTNGFGAAVAVDDLHALIDAAQDVPPDVRDRYRDLVDLALINVADERTVRIE